MKEDNTPQHSDIINTSPVTEESSATARKIRVVQIHCLGGTN
jgi:hypothetical protein